MGQNVRVGSLTDFGTQSVCVCVQCLFEHWLRPTESMKWPNGLNIESFQYLTSTIPNTGNVGALQRIDSEDV